MLYTASCTLAALASACVDFAREAGYRQVMLFTNSGLTSARRLEQRIREDLALRVAHHLEQAGAVKAPVARRLVQA